MSLLQKSRSVELSRRTQPFYAKKQNYSLGQQVQIEIDTQREFLDMETLRIQFVLKATDTSSTAKVTNRFTAANCIRNLRVKTLAGQMIGHEIREYRGFAQWMLKHKIPTISNGASAQTSFLEKMEGVKGGDDLGGNTTAGERKYSHKPLCHIFGLKEYYPAHFHQGLMIEFDLPQNAYEILQYATATPTIEFEEVRVLVDLVELKPELENEMVRLMEEQKLFVDYIEWLNQENSLTTATSQSYDVVGIDGRVKSAFVFWVEARGLDGTDDYWGDDDGGASIQDRNNLNSYRFRLGSRYLNYANVVCSDEGDDDCERVYELAKAMDIHHDLHSGKTFGAIGSSAGDQGIYGVGVKVDKAMSDVDEVISSQVDKDRNNMRVELNYGSSPTASDGYTYVVVDKRLQLLPGSVVRNVRA